jgi:hemerythrin superfamily protein
MDAIKLLKDDHKTVEHLFKRFEKAGDHAVVEKREVVDRIIEELSKHAAVEEQLFYPVIRATVPGTEDTALESLEEHHIVKWLLSELDGLDPEDERFDAKVTVLIENVRHHVKEEEGELFPKVRDELGRAALGDLGDAMAAAKRIAPTHPHPKAPDEPPGNLVMGAAAGVADRVGDTVSGLAQGGVTALADVIATVLNRKKPSVSPRGSTVARRTATTVRASAADATDAAIDATRRAKRAATSATRGTSKSATTSRSRTKKAGTKKAGAKKAGTKKAGTKKAGAKRTARAAKRGATSTTRAAKVAAKGTTTSARRSTKRVATTAKKGATTTARTARKSTKRTAAAAKRAATSSR